MTLCLVSPRHPRIELSGGRTTGDPDSPLVVRLRGLHQTQNAPQISGRAR